MQNPRRRLPLRAIAVFESVARRRSFQAAARELFITPSAVSQQIKKLEEQLSLRLFERRAQGIAPTEAALRLLPQVSRALAELDAAFTAAADPAPCLTVSTLPSVAAAWLVPRLFRFRQRCPGIAVRLETGAHLSDLQRDGVDLALRYGFGAYPGLHSEKLLDELCTPVGHPDYFRKRPLHGIADIANHPLIDDESVFDGVPYNDWKSWLARNGADALPANIVMTFTDSGMVLKQTLAGQGLALGRSLIVMDDLVHKSLRAPLAVAAPTGTGYHLVSAADRPQKPEARQFGGWIREEFQRHRKLMRKHFPPAKTARGNA